jgi:hypothetical protein
VLIQKQLRGVRRFGYRVSKENFLFMGLDIPSVSNTGGLRVFRCAAGKVNATAGNQESVTLQAITPRFALNLIASHKK